MEVFLFDVTPKNYSFFIRNFIFSNINGFSLLYVFKYQELENKMDTIAAFQRCPFCFLIPDVWRNMKMLRFCLRALYNELYVKQAMFKPCFEMNSKLSSTLWYLYKFLGLLKLSISHNCYQVSCSGSCCGSVTRNPL